MTEVNSGRRFARWLNALCLVLLVLASQVAPAAAVPIDASPSAAQPDGTPIVPQRLRHTLVAADSTSHLEVSASVSCVQPGGKTTVELEIKSPAKTTLGFTVTRKGTTYASTSVTLKAKKKYVVSVAKLRAGAYRIDVTDSASGLDQGSKLVVYTCVTAAVSCQGITFTNPATNPALPVLYGRTNRKTCRCAIFAR